MFFPKQALLIVSIFISIVSSSQVRLCVDVITKAKESGAGQGVFDFNNKWTPGTTLSVSFLGGSDWQKSEVKKYASLWSQYANVFFKFLQSGSGDVRISFKPQKAHTLLWARI
jgi:hypothetical protein